MILMETVNVINSFYGSEQFGYRKVLYDTNKIKYGS